MYLAILEKVFQPIIYKLLPTQSDSDLTKDMVNNKLLPLKELESITGMKRRIFEKGRKYLIALVLILTDSKFYPLKSFTEIPGISIEEKVPPQ